MACTVRVIKRRISRILANSRGHFDRIPKLMWKWLWRTVILDRNETRNEGESSGLKSESRRIFPFFFFSKTNYFGNSKSWRVDWEIWKLRVVDKIGRLEEIWIIFLFARIRKLKKKGRRVLIIRNWKLRDLNYLSFNDKKMRWIILSSLIEFWEYKFRKFMIIQIYF